MSLFDDILKGLPVNPLLREKIAELEAKYAATETENAILKDDLRDAKAENQNLRHQVEELSHKEPEPTISEIAVAILKAFAKTPEVLEDRVVASHCGLTFHVAKFHLEQLEDIDFLSSYQGFYSMSHKGREYLIKNSLI